MIELKNLSAGYDEEPVIEDVNTSFEPGKLTLILGKNGSGKSTLLKTMMGVLEPAQGTVEVDHKDLDSMNTLERAAKMSAVLQNQNPLSMSVFQYVLHGRFHRLKWPRKYSEEDRQEAWKALEKMGIEHLADAGMDEISGGERQKAALAQALCQNGEILFLDEPAAYLDASSQFDLYKKARDLAHKENRTVIMVSHDLPTALEYADEVRILNDHHLVFSGTPEDFVASKLAKKVFGLNIIEKQIEGRKRYLYS